MVTWWTMAQLEPDESSLVWKFRYYLRANKKALTKARVFFWLGHN